MRFPLKCEIQWISPHGGKIWIFQIMQKTVQNAYNILNFTLNNFVLNDQFHIPNV